MRSDLDLTDDQDDKADNEMVDYVEPPLSPDTDKVTWAAMIANAAKNVKHNLMVWSVENNHTAQFIHPNLTYYHKILP